ncbi:MAG: right-handed parallel beta-helix repeat-containing protein, partial [Gammaproteobacteria bacterium]
MLDHEARVGRFRRMLTVAAIAVGLFMALGFCTLYLINGMTSLAVKGGGARGSSVAQFGGSADRIEAVPTDIATNCSTDITNRLNSWLATVPDGATIMFAKGGCYRLDRTLEISHRNNLMFEGNGATLKRETPTPPELLNYNPPSLLNPSRLLNKHVFISNSKNIVIRNIAIVGLNTVSGVDPNSVRGKTVYEPAKFGGDAGRLNPGTTTRDKEGESGISIIGSDNINLTHVKIDAIYGDGISLGNDNAPVSRNITIKDVDIDRNGRQGVAFLAVQNVRVDNTRILHSYGGGFDLEPNGLYSIVKGVEIRDSYVNSYSVAFGLAGANDVSDINIHNNMVRNTLYSYPWFNGINGNKYAGVGRANWRIIDNTSLSMSSGIKVHNVRNVAIAGNRQVTAIDFPGVELINVEGEVSIKGNM